MADVLPDDQQTSWLEYESMDDESEAENPCDSGWCGDSACYRCNPWGYPR